MSEYIDTALYGDFTFTYEGYGEKYPDITISRLGQDRPSEKSTELSRLRGEFVIDVPLRAMMNLRYELSIVHALAAHAQSMGIRNPVWSGIRGGDFLRTGRLFGGDESSSSHPVARRGEFFASSLEDWKEVLGFAKNNPFDHMTRGETDENKGGLLVGYDGDALDSQELLRAPRLGETISSTVFAIYHPLKEDDAGQTRGVY